MRVPSRRSSLHVQALTLAVLALAMLAACASISPERRDFTIVEGRLSTSGANWECGTVPREGGGYFYVCDMPLDVHRVIFGQHSRDTITARFFHRELEREDEIVTGPHIRRDRRAAAILWQGEGGTGSFILMEFPGRWCVPDWMFVEFGVADDERARLRRAGYPPCSISEH